MFTDEIRRAIEAASRMTLPAVTALLWRAYGEGKVSEVEAEALSGLIEARTDAPVLRRMPGSGRAAGQTLDPAASSDGPATGAFQDRPSALKKSGVGSRPRTDASMERRRRWAASGRLPPGLAARFTLAEQAVLALVAAEHARRRDCRLSIEHMAAVAGVCRSTVKSAVREARKLGLVTVEERPVTGFRNDTNVVRVVAPEWLAWLRLARRDGFAQPGAALRPASPKGGGVKSATGTPTEVSVLWESRPLGPSKSCRKAAGDPDRGGRARIGAHGGDVSALRGTHDSVRFDGRSSMLGRGQAGCT